MFGYSEVFADFDYGDPAVDYICFTDDAELRSDVWKFILVEDRSTDPARLSKRYKHQPHLFLPQYESSLYIDNTIKLKVKPSTIFDQFETHEMTMLRHHKRDCIYDEAAQVIRARYDDPDIIQRQMEAYRELGYPEHNGLHAAGFMLRRHDSAAVQEACALWNTQIMKYSKRDQLSWNFCVWKLGFSFTSINENLLSNSMFDWPVLKYPVRVPRDFDDEIYLSLNPDVRQSGMNARKHYLLHGSEENRSYR
jgi:hypothetical protein